jgi:hypothetical protein
MYRTQFIEKKKEKRKLFATQKTFFLSSDPWEEMWVQTEKAEIVVREEFRSH